MPPLKLIIEFTAAGEVLVTGPIDNPMVCYGLIEIAKDVVRTRAAAAQSPIVKPAAAPGSAIRRG